MHWFLVIIVAGSYKVGVESLEFPTQVACEKGKAEVGLMLSEDIYLGSYIKVIKTKCIEKGD